MRKQVFKFDKECHSLADTIILFNLNPKYLDVSSASCVLQQREF